MIAKIFLVAALLPVTSALLFGGGGGGCGCAPPPCGCGRKKREAPAPTVRGQSGISSDSLCNNPTIRKIILKNLSEDPAVSKAAIHSEVKARLGGEYVVVCSQGSFSFIADTHNYCIDGSNNQTCYVFQA
ncbi:hypothetical protein FO519_001110 [Halicephalobus sp. NKZ332]|nr:hypothetical protein FO519_001110 [Halicephalobus sp. NKZ332]